MRIRDFVTSVAISQSVMPVLIVGNSLTTPVELKCSEGETRNAQPENASLGLGLRFRV